MKKRSMPFPRFQFWTEKNCKFRWKNEIKTFRSNKRLIQSQFFQRNGHTRHLPTYTHATYIPLNHSLSLSFSLTHLLKPQNALTSPYLKHIRSYSLFKWAKHGLCFLFFVLFNNNFNRRLTGIRTRIVGVKGEHADPFTTTTANRSLSFKETITTVPIHRKKSFVTRASIQCFSYFFSSILLLKWDPNPRPFDNYAWQLLHPLHDLRSCWIK